MYEKIKLRGGPFDGQFVDHDHYPKDFSRLVGGVFHVWRRQDDQAWKSWGNSPCPVYDDVEPAEPPAS
jgi:hypothetical protein